MSLTPDPDRFTMPFQLDLASAEITPGYVSKTRPAAVKKLRLPKFEGSDGPQPDMLTRCCRQ